MKLIQIYSNNAIFKPIKFNDGISFILSDAHSVGKTKLLELIDYCLLKNKPDFLKLDQFKDMDLEFYLEIKAYNKFITIKRDINNKRNSVSIKESHRSQSCLNFESKDYGYSGGKDSGLQRLNELLLFELLNKKINFRRYISYFLRGQDDQSDVFRLNKYRQSKDIDYKPIISNMLGIDGELIKSKYETENEISKLENEISGLKATIGNNSKEYIEAEIEAMDSIKADKKSRYEEFDFFLEEKNISKELVLDIEKNITTLNKKRNSLIREIEYINNASNTNLLIDIKELDDLFKELNVTFPNSIKTEYSKVIEFNKNLTQERVVIFKENKIKFIEQLNEVNTHLDKLNSRRKDALSVLKDSDTMSKFKKLEKEIITIETNINTEHIKLGQYASIGDNITTKCEKEKELANLIVDIRGKIDIFKRNSGIKTLVKKFARIIFEEEAIFVVSSNASNNLDFELKISNNDGFNNKRDEGNTFRKLLSFLFSIAIIVNYKDDNFFKYAVLDSPFDGDITNYQNGLYKLIEKVSNEHNMQIIITTVFDEIKEEYISKEAEKLKVRFLKDSDKLIGDF